MSEEKEQEIFIEKMKTFEDFDQFGWDGFAKQLTGFIQTESDFVEGSLVVSLNAGFGKGKSTFFEMWESYLMADEALPDVIRLNAWESDFINDPLLAIVFSVVRHLEGDEDKSEVVKKIKKGAGMLVRAGASLGNDFVAHVTGLDIVKAGQVAQKEDLLDDEKAGDKIYNDFNARCKALDDIREGLKEAFSEGSTSSLIVIVDELDRCRPDYAISYLETIKHIFDIPQLTFVLGVDKEALTCVAKSLFGADLNFDEYYRKFVHRNIALPEPDENATRRFCSKLTKQYLKSDALEEKGRYAYAKLDPHDLSHVGIICVRFELSPRQTHEMFRILAHIHSCAEEKTGRLLWGWDVSSLFLVTLSLVNHEFYEKIGIGKVTLREFGKFLQEQGFLEKNEQVNEWWMNALYPALRRGKGMGVDELLKVYQDLGLRKKTENPEDLQSANESLRQELSYFSSQGYNGNYGYDESVFMKIYKQVEGLKRFAD